MIAKVTLLAVCVASTRALTATRRMQSQEPSSWDAEIGALCQGNTIDSKRPTLAQTGPHTVSVAVPNGADALWIVDAYGDVLAFTNQFGTGTTSLTFEGGINQLVAHAHFTDCTHSAMATSFSTWQGLVDAYISSDQSGYSSSDTWSPLEIQDANLALTVDYPTGAGSPTARFSLNVANNRKVPFMFIRAQSGAILAYKGGAVQGDGTMELGNGNQNLQATLEAPHNYEANLYACAPLGTTIECDEVNVAPEIIASFKASTTASAAAVSPPVAFVSASTLAIHKPTDVTCTASASYQLYQEGGAASVSTVPSFAVDQSLLLSLSKTSCNYEAAATACTLTVGVICGTARRTHTIDVNAAFRSYKTGERIGTGSLEASASGCAVSHPVRGDLWTNENGELCECLNDKPACGSSRDGTAYLTPLEAAGVAVSCFVLFLILAAFCYRMYSKSKEMRELPIEGKRRSIIAGAHGDYVTGTRADAGMEMELPPPPPPETVPASDAPPPPPPPMRTDAV